MLYRGYVKTNGKQAVEKFKDVPDNELRSLEQAQECAGYAGVLATNTIMVDFDDGEQAEVMMNIVESLQLNCRVICTEKGKHLLFKNFEISSCKTKTTIAIGLTADIKVGFVNSYEVLKINGQERFIEWDVEDGQYYQTIPKWMFPIGKSKIDFRKMKPGDGRNQELFNYILTLQSKDFNIEEIRETIRIINTYVLPEPLSEDELETILRDDAFKKPIFKSGSQFLHDKFANYLKTLAHVVVINDNLHIYINGIYEVGYRKIESEMIKLIPDLTDAKRKEVLKYMFLICEEIKPADARYIAFRNGIYDVGEDIMIPFNPEIHVTNKIPWDYNPSAYCELADKTLNKLACGDESIRLLLEECIGYCFYRRNEMRKSFILTGGKRNGKSTFLDCVKEILGNENISTLDIQELGDRFSTSMMFGKLANIGDDIPDDFLQGKEVAIFKKLAAGNRIKAERKGIDPFEFDPYIKMLFSANDIPRMKDKSGAGLDRLVIIPFNATFDKTDPDYDPFIKYKLIQQDSLEYMIALGVKGLKRLLEYQSFTKSDDVDKQIKEYEEENNPIISFIYEVGEDSIINEPTGDVYRRYTVFCAENSMQPMSNIAFSKQITKRLGTDISFKRIGKRSVRVFTKKG